MKVAAIQHDIAWCDRQANFAHLEPLIAQAAENGAELIVLSETFSTGFAVEDTRFPEPEGGESSQFLTSMAHKYRAHVVGSCPEFEVGNIDSRPANTLVLAHPTGALTRYRKIHPFTFGGEDKHVKPGNEFVTVNVGGFSITFFICYDLRFANEFWALAKNTDVYVIPANWPSSRREHWMTLLKARAIENQAYVIGCNRVGDGGNLHYSGDSLIIDPFGKTLAKADDQETIIYADLDQNHLIEIRKRFPFLQDRRSNIQDLP